MTDISHIKGADEIYQSDVECTRIDEYVMRLDSAMNNSSLMDLFQG